MENCFSGRDRQRRDEGERGEPGGDHWSPRCGAEGDGRTEHGAEAARDGADAVPAGERDVQGQGPVREALEHSAQLHHKGLLVVLQYSSLNSLFLSLSLSHA